MKRGINYTTEDGQRFTHRALARRHEVGLGRRKRVGECLRLLLKAQSEAVTFSLETIADGICKHSGAFAEALSARAAVRATRRSTPKPLCANA